MRDGYYSIGDRATIEITINKSRFIGDAFHVATEEDALKAIQSIEEKYPDATHHC